MEEYSFSQNEYIFLLSLLESNLILGIENPFSTPQEEQSAMEGAFKSLLEAGRITAGVNKVEIASEVAPIIAACASPLVTIVSTYTNALEEHDVRFIHIAEQGIIEDVVLPSNGRCLATIDNKAQIAEHLRGQYHFDEQAAVQAQECKLSISDFEMARNLIPRGKKAILWYLRDKSQISESTADVLADSLLEPVSNAALAKMLFGKDSRPVSSIGFVESAKGLWAMTFLEGEEVQFQPVDATQAVEMIGAYVDYEKIWAPELGL